MAEVHPTIPPSDHPPSAPHPALPGDPPHMRRDWKPPLTERSLDAALWYGQTGERVGRRAEKKVDQLGVGLVEEAADRVVLDVARTLDVRELTNALADGS